MSRPLEVFNIPLKGISLVEASAGTGKTYNITSLYVRFILEESRSPSEILVMTYTEAATAELKYRLRKRLRESLKVIQGQDFDEKDQFLKDLAEQQYDDAEDKILSAIKTFDEAAVFTIHGFCSRLLKEYALRFEVSPEFELLTDQTNLIQESVDDHWRKLLHKAETEEHWYILLDYLTDLGFGPDELRVAFEEVQRHPYATLKPDGLQIQDLFGELETLKEQFGKVQELWKTEGESLREIFYSGNLHGGIYRPGSRESDWKILTRWIERDHIKLSVSDRLANFGTKMPDKGSKKSYQVPHLDLFEAIQHYLDLADRLSLLKPALIKESIQDIQDDVNKRKRSANLLSYDDLLSTVHDSLAKDSTGALSKLLSTKYPIALVDEFQDTDPIQYGIFKKIYEDRKACSLFMIGDPKQAIYSFRGADIYTYLEAKNDADEDRSYDLQSNYRSNESLIKGINELFGTTDHPFQHTRLEFKPANFPKGKKDEDYLKDEQDQFINPIQCISIEDSSLSTKEEFTEEISEAVVQQVQQLLSGNYRLAGMPLKEKDIAILIRKTVQGERIQAKLRAKGIKSVLRSRESVFKTRESDELYLILKALQKISYEPGVRAALATELMGFTGTAIGNLLEDQDKWGGIIRSLLDIREVWENKGIASAMMQLMSIFDIPGNMAKKENGERRYTNLMHLLELMDIAEREQKLTGVNLLKWVFNKRNKDSADTDEEQLRLESDEDLIHITTIHSSKGLEYPVVLCPFLWDSRSNVKKGDIFKYYDGEKVCLDISQKSDHGEKTEGIRKAEDQMMAEDIRLIYVALTRAVASCFLFIPDYEEISDSSLAAIFSHEEEERPDFQSLKEILNEMEYVEVGTYQRKQQLASPAQPQREAPNLRSMTFKRKDLMNGFKRMLSYSSLSKRDDHGEYVRDYDDVFSSQKEVEDKEKESKNRFTFPKGANAGSCLHNILEHMDFQDPNDAEELIQEQLDFYGFDARWKETLHQWLLLILSHPLNEDGFCLQQLSEADLLKEMEFFFPVDELQVQHLWKQIRTGPIPDALPDEVYSGYMKGYIDLVLRNHGRYYLLDYKSNYLGDRQEDYAPEEMKLAILDAGYDLQYHIYCLALHRYLKTRIADYDYEKHFGGVWYVFMRGMDGKSVQHGVYFDRPDRSIIESMDELMRKGGRG